MQHDQATHYVNKRCWKRTDDGWCPSEREVRKLPPEDQSPEDQSDAAEEDESLSIIGSWQTIATHGLMVGEEVKRIAVAVAVAPSMAELLHLAGRWHDLGKAHIAFQNSIRSEDRPERGDIAKFPDVAWPCNIGDMYRMIGSDDQRRGFRHELASVLGLFGVLQRHHPQHDALLGPWRGWFEALGEACAADRPKGNFDIAGPTAIEQEILALNTDEFNLLAYLVCAHHGKVRVAWHASPADQKADSQKLCIHGVLEGDILPPVLLAGVDGEYHQLPATALDLAPSEAGLSPRTGSSWSERVLNLVERFGPFTLAWLETLLRAADQRMSALSIQPISDTLLQSLEKEHARQSLDGSGRTLAQPTEGGAPPPPLGSDSSPRGQFYGNGGRASGRGVDSRTTRPPHSATRYIETSIGILNYQELAPLLAEQVGNAEIAIVERALPEMSMHELLLDLHRRICADLTPGMAGRWRLHDVRVSAHRPPPYWQVPMLMHDYASDLDTRLKAWDNDPDRSIETLTFAEGKLLEIHPFEDFNGRVARLLLIELTCRFDLPEIDPAVSSEEKHNYFVALRAYDHGDPRPLAAIWSRRLSGGRSR